ncbi:MAG TPA: methyltransferase domain-containing protein [Anaeromyxobacteraceae bacterium]|nr:methyltransferase domain-containing protein [Anaeromyxobacteraceae bacterium]
MARSTRRGGRDQAHGSGPGQPHPGDPGHVHAHEPGGAHVHAGHDRLGNPQDLAAYLTRLEGEDRLAWQKPDEVIRLLGVKRGDRVCDVGVGPGYFALRLARAVGPQGEVYAFDAEPRMLEVLRQRMAQERLFHVHPILAEEGVPPRPCDLVLVVNTFHHFRDGPGYLRRLAGHLKPGGRIANVDFHKRDLPVGPPLEHKVTREDFLAAAREAGLRLAAEHDVLPYQYFLVLEPDAAIRVEAGAAAPTPRVETAGSSAPPQPEPARRPAAAPKHPTAARKRPTAARKRPARERPARRRQGRSGAAPSRRRARRGSRR